MAKNTKDISDHLELSRQKQLQKRKVDVDVDQTINPDVANNVTEALYSKGLPHDQISMLGDKFEIKQLQFALETGRAEDFEGINLSGVADGRKLASPQASLSSELSGGDPEGFTMVAPPALDSAKAAAEMAEVYLKNIYRDVPFANYGTDPGIAKAIGLLNALHTAGAVGGYPHPVTTGNIFRGNSPTCLVGGYVSQLYLHTIGVGNFSYEPVGPTDAGSYGIRKADYLKIQEGVKPGNGIPAQMQTNTGAGNGKYMFNGRQLGSTVHVDLVFQHFYEAAAILLNAKVGVGAQIDVGSKEGNFIGGPVSVTTMLSEVSRHALKAAWVQKWRKHMRLRPEAMAARIVAEIDGDLPVGTVTVDSRISSVTFNGESVIDLVKAHNAATIADPVTEEMGEDKPWLPLQYAEGSPTHPAYPAGHATIAGACATILKIMFSNPTQPWSDLSDPSIGLAELEPNEDGTGVTAVIDSGTTIHGEIDKLAHNVALGRDFAGVHYRSDSELALGEKVAIQYYKDQKALFNEEVDLVTFNGFDGNPIEV